MSGGGGHQPPSGEAWHRALSFAARAHEHQKRKDGVTPYAAHPARVAMTVAVVFGETDPDVLAAACLHDVIEDAGVDYDELAEAFGERVAGLVAALTKDATLPEADREAAYDRRLAAAPGEARLIKLADVYDNAVDSSTRRGAGKGSKAIGPRMREKMRRAVALAAGDDAPASRRAIDAVQGLLDAIGD